MQLLLAAALVGAAILAAAATVAGRIAAAAAADAARARRAQLLAMFAPAIAAAEPRALLTWQPIAAAARALFPDDFIALDRAAGRTFPFSADDLQAAHARWSADWLAWEQAHDADYKLKAALAAEELQRSGGSPLVRARCESVEREKLELYQRRYEEYTRVSKALKALAEAQKIG